MKNGLYQQLLDHNFNNVHMILELEGRGKISQHTISYSQHNLSLLYYNPQGAKFGSLYSKHTAITSDYNSYCLRSFAKF